MAPREVPLDATVTGDRRAGMARKTRPAGADVQHLYRREVELYDIAFGWDVDDEVTWLLERLRVTDGPLLEPGCGTGRMLEAIGRRGIPATGIDHSPEMVAYARQRLAHWSDLVTVEQADMTAFELEVRFAGAFCPVNTLAYLAPTEMSRHLGAMARHLRAGARYLIQLDLRAPGEDPRGSSTWTMSRGGTKLEITWSVDDYDPTRRHERHRSTIVVTQGERRDDVVEETHDMTSWTPDEWRATVAASPFDLVTVHADEGERAELPPGAAGELLWHVLELRSDGAGPRAAIP